jgi:hypothetical protein
MPRDTLIQHEEPQTRQTAKLIHISDISHIDSEEGIGGIDVARRDFFFLFTSPGGQCYSWRQEKRRPARRRGAEEEESRKEMGREEESKRIAYGKDETVALGSR